MDWSKEYRPPNSFSFPEGYWIFCKFQTPNFKKRPKQRESACVHSPAAASALLFLFFARIPSTDLTILSDLMVLLEKFYLELGD